MGDADALLALFTFAAGGAVWRVWIGIRARRFASAHRRTMSCPQRGSDVSCLLIRDDRTGRWTTVASCSALPGGVTCDQRCRDVLNRGIPLRPSLPPPRGAPGAGGDEG